MVVLSRLQQLDTRLFLWTTRRRHLPLIARIARQISRSADGLAYPPLILMLLLADNALSRHIAMVLILTFMVERPIYFALKNSLRRNRPAAALAGYNSFIVPSDRFSFPSGHTSAAFVVASAISLVWPVFGVLLLFWALLVAMSRITLGVHFPGDTLAGAVMGGSLVLIVNTLVAV